jgi:hypothetical protein
MKSSAKTGKHSLYFKSGYLGDFTLEGFPRVIAIHRRLIAEKTLENIRIKKLEDRL